MRRLFLNQNLLDTKNKFRRSRLVYLNFYFFSNFHLGLRYLVLPSNLKQKYLIKKTFSKKAILKEKQMNDMFIFESKLAW